MERDSTSYAPNSTWDAWAQGAREDPLLHSTTSEQVDDPTLSRITAVPQGPLRTDGPPRSDPQLREWVLVWREIARKTVGDIFHESTGQRPELEEVEFLCTQNDTETNAQHLDVMGICREEHSESQVNTWEEWLPQHELQDNDGNLRRPHWLSDQDATRTPHTTHTLETAGAKTSRIAYTLDAHFGEDMFLDGGCTPKLHGEATPCQVIPTEAGLPAEWKAVFQQAIEITRKQCAADAINNGEVPPSLQQYILALCDPSITTIICHGGPGTGKTYTATLVAMLALAAGVATKLQHTKPLVSTGGVGIGYERGSVNDKLAFWTRPTRQAAERVAEERGIDPEILSAQVESFPIDRARGLSIPSGEWMVSDEMQNCNLPLFTCMMTRAESGSKVVLCGDVGQSDLTAKKAGGMSVVVGAWRRLIDAGLGRQLGGPQPSEEGAQAQIDELSRSFRFIEMDGTCNMRNTQNTALTEWIKTVDQPWNIATHAQRNEVETAVSDAATTTTVGRVANLGETPPLSVPIYSALAGADNLGHCLSNLPGAFMAGGSETDENAAEAFRRRHRFAHFDKPDELTPHILEGVYVVCSGRPRSRRTTPNPQHQLTHYLDAQVPIILLEHVPECRKKPGQQTLSPFDLQGAAVARLEAQGYHVPRGDDGHPGQLLTPTDFGGIVDRPRLFTIAVQQQVWDRRHMHFRWPDWTETPPRPVRAILDSPAEEKYVCREDNAKLFDRLSHAPRPNRPHQIWRRRGRSSSEDGHWDDPHRIYSLDHPMPAPTTTASNTPWFEVLGPWASAGDADSHPENSPGLMGLTTGSRYTWANGRHIRSLGDRWLLRLPRH